MSSVAIITARGGSKRIPRKNIKEFCGKPIIAYSIEAALKAELFDEVMVSTDDAEIAEVARKYGAQVPFMRSAKNSDDYATTADVLSEVLEIYEQQGKFFDIMCCIYPTAPFVTSEKLQKAYEAFLEYGRETVVPVVSFSFPPQRSFVLKNGKLAYKYKENINSRSQDLEEWYHDAGQFYFHDVAKFKDSCATGNAGGEYIPFILPETEVQDIDNLTDWEIAEAKFKVMQKQSSK